MEKKDILKVLEELRKESKRKFAQTVDLIINLKSFDVKRENMNLVADLPHVFKKKKVCAFFTKKSSSVDTITKEEFKSYQGKELKNLAKKYDFFIAVAPLMPAVATSFGRVLGPLGKMPSPQLGIVPNEEETAIVSILEKINTSIKIRAKEASIKIAVGKEDMKDEEIVENTLAIYNSIFKALPRKKENLKSILIKFTMSKPKKIEIK